jgi:antitoxin FitA
LRGVTAIRNTDDPSQQSTDIPRLRNLGQAINERFGELGGVDLPDVPRETIRPPVDFGE